MPESLRLEFLEKLLANNLALSDAEDNICGPMKIGTISDLPLKTLLAIHQKSGEPRFWQVMYSFVLVAYSSLATSRTLLQKLPACLNFTLDSKDLRCWYKQKSDFYEVWQEHKQLKTMEICEVWPDTYDEECMHQFQPEPTYKIH